MDVAFSTPSLPEPSTHDTQELAIAEQPAEEPEEQLAEMSTHQPLVITVSDPQREGGVADSHVTYQITTKSAATGYRVAESVVRRRFQDFYWLYKTLKNEFAQCILPTLPEKHRMEYLKGGRFDKDFIERRRAGLERFMSRVARHPVLERCDATRKFLSEEDFARFPSMH